MTYRVLMHVQHLLGTGHARRAAAIGAALAAAGMDVEILSGGSPVAGLPLGAARLTQLPPIAAADVTFRRLVDAGGAPIDDAFRAMRRELVLARLAALRPDAVITELYPFGRRAIAFELAPLIEAASALDPRPLVLCSLRDVLIAPADPRKIEAALLRAYDLYDRVLVHGDPAFLPLQASYPAAAGLGERVVYTGYVVAPPANSSNGGEGREEVVVSIGGGAVGAALVAAAIQGRRRMIETRHAAGARTWRLLLGTNLPADAVRQARAAAQPGLVVEPARGDFPALLSRAHVSVSQAGYNTVMDILQAGVRAVLVPFAADGESEQTQRAEALARRGWAQVVAEGGLTAERLAAAIAQASALPPPPRGALASDGAATTARLVATWLTERAGPR
ncbi:MAG TPA: glycosyltransferase [Alphaproteobacteria bacterium]|nr:glycosyltransferase [Alphaproteobacteria bacterium]